MAARKIKIVVCDDQADVEKSIIASIPKALSAAVTRIEPTKISELVAALQKRNAAARTGKRKAPTDPIVLDGADIFIVDYDLIDAAKTDYFTGETLARLARCFSDCGSIIALNQYHQAPTFDLTLNPDIGSFADLNLSIDELKNAGLWAQAWKGYRPWRWPLIPQMAKQLAGRVQEVAAVSLATKITSFLQLPESAVDRIPAKTWELIGENGTNSTLADVIDSTVLGFKGREAGDRKKRLDQDTRIVAARLHAWLNAVFATQDILIDLPHLAARCPSVMGKKTKLSDFNAIAKMSAGGFAKAKPLKAVQFTKAHWLDRPAWFWTEIESKRLVDEVATPWLKRPSNFVFCEDTSRFVARKDAKSFQTDLPTSFRTRFVEQVAKVEYKPSQRLAAN